MAAEVLFLSAAEKENGTPTEQLIGLVRAICRYCSATGFTSAGKRAYERHRRKETKLKREESKELQSRLVVYEIQ